MLSSSNVLDIVVHLGEWPKHLARAGVSSDVQQQLEQQVAAACEQLANLHVSMSAAETTPEAASCTSSSLQPDAAAAAQHLNSMAQAVAGSIALSVACNNPGCSNLAQRSELVLVGGKSCVCARCKVAR
jgi:regulator of protease activity HflC (stomatin/prohibitin superfamily)